MNDKATTIGHDATSNFSLYESVGVNGPFQIVSRLTPCHQASGKGSGGGVVCRACYAPVSDIYGAAWLSVADALKANPGLVLDAEFAGVSA